MQSYFTLCDYYMILVIYISIQWIPLAKWNERTNEWKNELNNYIIRWHIKLNEENEEIHFRRAHKANTRFIFDKSNEILLDGTRWMHTRNKHKTIRLIWFRFHLCIIHLNIYKINVDLNLQWDDTHIDTTAFSTFSTLSIIFIIGFLVVVVVARPKSNSKTFQLCARQRLFWMVENQMQPISHENYSYFRFRICVFAWEHTQFLGLSVCVFFFSCSYRKSVRDKF